MDTHVRRENRNKVNECNFGVWDSSDICQYLDTVRFSEVILIYTQFILIS